MRLFRKKLPPRPRVVLIGDSITEWWGRYSPTMFDSECVNRGTGGQNTAGMLARFTDDVIPLRPQYVHIMGGTNDLWHTLSPEAPDWVISNVGVMVDLAHGSGIKTLIGSVPPINPSLEPSGHAWAGMIVPLNERLQQLALDSGSSFIDYAVAIGPAGNMERRYSDDGVHPNKAGYSVMGTVFGEIAWS